MKKLLTLGLFCISNVYALSLGDSVTNNTIKTLTTTTSTMKLTAQKSDHSEYTISSSTGATIALVNKNDQVYGFQWNDKTPDLSSMLGSYKSEFNTAFANRQNKFDHRRLMIDTPNLSVNQFGLPGGKMQGSMYAKGLEPK